MVTVRIKFFNLQETSETPTPNDKHENFITTDIEAAECIPTKPRVKCRVHWESIVVREKQNNMKKAFLLNKRNLTNANVYKYEKDPRKLTHTK